MEVTRILAAGVLFIVTSTPSHQAHICGGLGLPCASGLYRASNEPKKRSPKTKFWDHQREPIPTLITGEKAMQIKTCIDTLSAPCFLSQRKKAEKALVELISPYELETGSVGDMVGCTWSSTINFFSAPERRLLIILIHCGGSAPGLSLWAVHEDKDGAVVFPFEGHMKGCGPWQVLNDLDADAKPEMIVKHFIGNYDGAGTIAVWPTIYKWNGNNYIRADDEFPEYYAQEVVPKYQKILEERKDWRNHTDEQIRQVYEKCKFILQKAESIAKKTKPSR